MSTKTIDHRFKTKGHAWRVQSDDRGRFDELVVAMGKLKTTVIHAEMMDTRSMFVDVAGVSIWVHVGRDGVARITEVEDHRILLGLAEADRAVRAPAAQKRKGSGKP